ncbi:MAG TPA: S-adenosyl-l-methionine hydroxide adenosyltransferase family protein [Terriglobia bacterium]|nr:S-adenosyl-l-methionine hydroxide adenosyltransferase family protein [Terriglobia bacterium]
MSNFARARVRTLIAFLLLLARVAVTPNRAILQASQASAPPQAGPPTIVFMTDFGIDNDAVPICKGVMWGIDPDVRIVDLTHAVTPYSILDGARFLYGATPYYPEGTVFVVVIDPTVGSSRKAVVVKSKRGQFFVLPDNGLMTLVEDRDGIEGARAITNPAWMIGKAISSTFHGRDIFSPVGAHLARGDDWTRVGPEVQELVRLNIQAARLDEKGIAGDIIALDTPFGNLISNIEADEFLKLGYARGDQVRARLGNREMVLPFVKTFSDVALGKPLLYIDSRGHLGLAVNQKNFSQVYGIRPPLKLFIARKANLQGSSH